MNTIYKHNLKQKYIDEIRSFQIPSDFTEQICRSRLIYVLIFHTIRASKRKSKLKFIKYAALHVTKIDVF